MVLCQSTKGITINAAKKCHRQSRPYSRLGEAALAIEGEEATVVFMAYLNFNRAPTNADKGVPRSGGLNPELLEM